MSALERFLPDASIAQQADDGVEAFNDLAEARGWSDGLPLIVPTAARVEAMLAYCDRPIDRPVGALAPRYGEATPLRVAANAVMAGCRPSYFPLVLTALEALCEAEFNLYGVQATTHPCTPLLIVNGPVATELGINSGHNAFGPGWRANATIGRAVRLALLNIGGAVPGVGDMATAGTPAKYTYCAAENEALSPWEPLHVTRGFAREASTVTVVGAEGPHNVNDHESLNGEGILATIAGTAAITGSNNPNNPGSQIVIAFGPEHAATVAGDGFSKADVQRFLFERARLPISRFSSENVERRLKKRYPERFADATPDTPVPMVQAPEDFVIAVIGGPGKHSVVIPTFGTTRMVTRALRLGDGRLARSVEEFRGR